MPPSSAGRDLATSVPIHRYLSTFTEYLLQSVLSWNPSPNASSAWLQNSRLFAPRTPPLWAFREIISPGSLKKDCSEKWVVASTPPPRRPRLSISHSSKQPTKFPTESSVFFRSSVSQVHDASPTPSVDDDQRKSVGTANNLPDDTIRADVGSHASLWREGISRSRRILKVYTPAKTVTDCFKFRNKIGLEVALEALRESRRLRKASMDELWAAAKICRVANMMRPYRESL
jgi:hypothetical protein